jgi:hypothetical protein
MAGVSDTTLASIKRSGQASVRHDSHQPELVHDKKRRIAYQERIPISPHPAILNA